MTEFEWMDIFGGNLEDVMHMRGYNQKQLADETGLSESTISRYIRGIQMPSIKAIVNIVHVLDCNLDDLICIEDMIE